jgi:hypothetical protein
MKATHPMNDEEAGASLTGSARADALRALRVLAETAETPAADDTETPPLPANLRDQWLETYGEPAPAPVVAGARSGESWVGRLVGFFTRPRIAWAGGLAAAAAVVVLLMQQPEPASDGPRGGVVTRGGGSGTVVSGAASSIIVVAPADKAGPLLQELARAYPSRAIQRVDLAPSGLEDGTIVVDTGAGVLRRFGQPAVEAIEGDPLTDPARAIMAIEGVDEPDPR